MPATRSQSADRAASDDSGGLGAWRLRLAVLGVTAVNELSRHLGLGSGTVAGGRVGLVVAPDLLEVLAGSRRMALVSGTNGKTTTTALLAAALSGPGVAPVTNATGANMPEGHVAALVDALRRKEVHAPAVLEVDEGYLPALVAATAPRAVVLLNLSRDQLDRTNEVRMTAGRWRAALGEAGETTVVANCDDPLVAWAGGTAPSVLWVAAGAKWLADAVGCPACSGRVIFDHSGWACSCGFSRPQPDVTVTEAATGQVAVRWSDGRCLPVRLAIPGRFNQANAALAAAAAGAMGVPAERALEAMSQVDHVAGRFAVVRVDGVDARLLLAKNPAGWMELLELVETDRRPLVVGINARVADGRDPSWLWDVPFEQLRGRQVVASGDRCADLSVRLRYAEVSHQAEPDLRQALQVADRLDRELDAGEASRQGPVPKRAPIDFVGNYTAFHELWRP